MTGGGIAEVSADHWDPLLISLGCDDVYLTRGYLAGARLLDPGDPVLLHVADDGGDVVFAALLRGVPGGGLDVTSPYGYGGPVAIGDDPPVERFYEHYEQWCAERGVISTFLRFHPLFDNAAQARGAIRLELLGRTVSWQLDGEDDLLAGMHPNHRNTVRKALRAGAQVDIVERPEDASEFVDLYEATMLRLGASDYYRFPKEYWSALFTELRDRLTCIHVRVDGALAASALFLSGARWLHYHLAAASDAGRSCGASNLLLLEAARYGREQGFEQLHLGAGLGGREDSLFAFKAHFAPGHGLRELFIGKAVHDRDRYLALAGERELSFDGYFPAYRRLRV